jgi:hypothetical protein
LETLARLRAETRAVIHADLIAGLPHETLETFAKGFDELWIALSTNTLSKHSTGDSTSPGRNVSTDDAANVSTDGSTNISTEFEIQLGILKLLPGTALARDAAALGLRCNPEPPYEVYETPAMTCAELDRVKNFARFWELTVNRGIPVAAVVPGCPVFAPFMALADSLLAHFGRNWGIDKNQLRSAVI